MDYSVSEYRPADKGEVVKLLALLISAEGELNRAYLEWKYEQNPFVPPPRIFLVRFGNTIVGMRGYFGSLWRLGVEQTPVALPCADDLVIEPSHRNRGLFLPLNRAMASDAREAGFQAMLSLSAGQTTQKLSGIAGWRSAGDLDRIHRPANGVEDARGLLPTPSVVRQTTTAIGRKVARRLGRLRRGLPSDGALERFLLRIGRGGASPIEWSAEADLSGMGFLAASVAEGRLGSVRSESYYAWRLRHPTRKYRYLYWRDSRLRGFLILGWANADLRRLRIVDYAVEDDSILRDLLRALTRHRGHEAGWMSQTLPNAHLRLATESGFLPDPRYGPDSTKRFLFLPLGDEGASGFISVARSFPSNWRLCLLDTMGS